MIPDVPREAIDESLQKFDADLRDSAEWRHWEDRQSQKYAIEANGLRYPPKQIIRMATGARGFSGGDEANGYLQKRGFNIISLRSDVESIQRALEEILGTYSQARTEPFGKNADVWILFEDVCTALRRAQPVAKRPKLTVKFGVGKGNWARVPWISFQHERFPRTQAGVYCVLLFREDMSGVYLTLNQGVTDLKEEMGARRAKDVLRERAVALRAYCDRLATLGFRLDDMIDLRTEPGLGADYEVSTVSYKLYETGSVPSDPDILADLEAVLEAYDQYLKAEPSSIPAANTEGEKHRVPSELSLAEAVADFASALERSHVSFGPRHVSIVRSFVVSLATKPLVILTGLSGSGKTQIALRFGEWLGQGSPALIPVRPDWTGSEALFGFEDALQPASADGRRAWHVPDALAFMLSASREPQSPRLLILDEMNLAHVERYFADVLSGMESRTAVLPNLENEDDVWRQVPGDETRIPVPRNLFIVGTVNVDETTYMFSPKVLDRANTFEFRVETADLALDARKPVACDPGDSDLVRVFLSLAMDDQWHLEHPAPKQAVFEGTLRRLHALLSVFGFEFGHRVFFEANRFAAILAAGGEPDPQIALDLQVMQKILPRLHGARRRIEPALLALARFSFDLTSEPAETDPTFDPTVLDVLGASLPASFGKLRRMIEAVRANQFVSFTE